MNLAIKEIKHTFGKFLATAMGVGMLLGIVLIMIGVYRGMVIDAKVLLDDIGGDLWVVQDKTLGPFAESSRIYEDLKNSLKSIDGVKTTAPFTFQTTQLPTKTGKMRVTIVGYDIFGDINPIKQLKKGRMINKSHYEIVVSEITGYHLGDKIKLSNDIYKVVGITDKNLVSSGGDAVVFVNIKDAKKLQFTYTNPRIRNDRARGMKVSKNSNLVNAIVIKLKKGYNPTKVANHIKEVFHKAVYTQQQEKTVLTQNLIKRAAKQIGLFTIILVLVSTIIIALIIYTMTLEKMKEIAIMKLIGIPNMVIVRMIFEETIILGFLAFIFGNFFSHLIYTKFPKRVVLESNDALILFIVIIIASMIASLIGIRKVLNADPQEAIGG